MWTIFHSEFGSPKVADCWRVALFRRSSKTQYGKVCGISTMPSLRPSLEMETWYLSGPHAAKHSAGERLSFHAEPGCRSSFLACWEIEYFRRDRRCSILALRPERENSNRLTCPSGCTTRKISMDFPTSRIEESRLPAIGMENPSILKPKTGE